MFFRNDVKTRKGKIFISKLDTFDKNALFDYDKKNGDNIEPQIFYNVSVSNGYLQDSYGIKNLALPSTYGGSEETQVTVPSSEIKKMWGFHWYNSQLDVVFNYIFYLDEDNNLNLMDEVYRYDMFTDLNTVFTTEPAAFQYEVYSGDSMIFSSKGDGVVVVTGSGTVVQYQDAEKLSSCCFHENCLYGVLATDDNTLVYSKNLNVLDWENSDINTLKFYDDGGRLNKVVSFNDYVYLFRDKAIVKIYPYSVNTDLSVTNMYESSSFIFPKTVSICGEEILFLTRDGLYSFNGSLVSKVDLHIFDRIVFDKTQKIVSIFHNGKYFLACHMNFGDTDKIGCENEVGGCDNNAVVIYDTKTKNVEVMRGVDIRDFAIMESKYMNKLVCIFGGSNKSKIGEFTLNGKILGTTYQRKWTSKVTDFGHKGKTKILKTVNLTATKNCQVVIKSDKESKTLQIKGSEHSQRIKANVRGESFEISIISTEDNLKVKVPEFEVLVLL